MDPSVKYKATVKCETGHAQTITFEGLSEEWVAGWCGLIDGTSPIYLRSPIGDPHSVIGKCGICGEQVRATWEPVSEDDEV